MMNNKNKITTRNLVENIEINKLIPYARNPRKNEGAVAKVAASIQEFGFRNPILVEPNMTIIAGHTRYLAAQKIGLSEVPVIIVDGLTKAQIKAFRIADNRVAQEAEWDNELLGLELQDLQELDFDLNLTGFNPDELEQMLHVEQLDPQADEDDVPEAPTEPKTKKGDVWILGSHRLMCGDSAIITDIDKLMDGQKANMIFTDPPYNLASENDLVASTVSKSIKQLKESKWDKDFNIDEVLNALFNFMQDTVTVYICSSHHLAPNIWIWMKEWASHYSWCVWSKPNPMPSLMKRHWTWNAELICYATRGKHIFNFPKEGHALSIWEFTKEENDLHPTQKPVKIPEHAILHSSKTNQLILDLFGGSGSTLIACEKNNRKCHMMEINPRFCDVIIERWQKYTGKRAINGETGEEF